VLWHGPLNQMWQQEQCSCKPTVFKALYVAGFEACDLRSGCALAVTRGSHPLARRAGPDSLFIGASITAAKTGAPPPSRSLS